MTTLTTISPFPQVVHRAPERYRSDVPVLSRAGASVRSRRGTSTRVECVPPVSWLDTALQRKLDPLGRYTDAFGRTREVIAVQRVDSSVLVVDRDAITLGDRRLVAHLGADEPAENAALVCAHYLKDAHRGRCRRVNAEDLTGSSSVGNDERKGLMIGSPHALELVERRGGNKYLYRLALVRTDTSAMELRWRRHPRRGGSALPTPVCLREVIGAIEAYEPACGLTLRALALYREDAKVSTAVLRSELERLRESPIVLNRRLRQAVLATIECHGLSMSEIAIRCGRIKRDSKGNTSGETSWLARRLGILPESGASRPTSWIHSDVLALVARNGLGISPREVELG